MKKTNRFASLLCLSSLLLLPAFALGQTNFIGGGNLGPIWNDATNWDNGLPSMGPQNANIGDTFSVILETDQSCNELDLVGDQSTGTASLRHSTGALTGSGWLKIGLQSETDGSYVLTSGASSSGWSEVFVGRGANDACGTLLVFDAGTSISSSGGLKVGTNLGEGHLGIVFDGSVSAEGSIDFGLDDGGGNGVGRLQMTSGTLTAGGALTVSGDSLAIIHAGTVTTGGEFSANTDAEVYLNGGDVTTNEFIVRENGFVNQTAGTITASNWISVGQNGGTATYRLRGGSLDLTNDFITVGETANGSLDVSGDGSVNVNTGTALGIIVGRYFGVGMLGVRSSMASVNTADLRVGLDENLNDNSANGILRWVADPLGTSPIVSADNTDFSPGDSKLSLDFSADPLSLVLGTEYLLIDNAAAVSGTFAYRPEGSIVDFVSGTGTISYVGGTDGFDVVVTVAAAPPSTALASFCSDFEDLVPGNELSPIGDGWQFFHTNGSFPSYDGLAPQGPQICTLADAEGDPGKSGKQDLLGGGGNKYLNIYSDYNNPQPTVAFTNRVFQEQTFSAADAASGQTRTLSFDYAGAEDPFYPGASGAATTAAFIRVLDNSSNELASATFDTSAANSLVFAHGKVSLTFDPAWTKGGIVQFGFISTRTGNDPTGIYYDNVCFFVLGDANDDGVFSNLDIASFVLALTNLPAYQAMFPSVDPNSVLDMNCDGVFDNLDIAPFVAALTGS